jgi:hypothetical protein
MLPEAVSNKAVNNFNFLIDFLLLTKIIVRIQLVNLFIKVSFFLKQAVRRISDSGINGPKERAQGLTLCS